MQLFSCVKVGYRYLISTATLILIFTASVQCQQIYSDRELLDKGITYYNANNYRLAQVFLFAYVQRNTRSYQTDKDFKVHLDAVLGYASTQSFGASAYGQFDKVFPNDAQGRSL